MAKPLIWGYLSFVGLAVLVALLLIHDPRPSSGADGLSEARAMAHLEELAKQARTLNSAHHEVAVSYLVARLTELGLEAEVQEATVVREYRGYKEAARARNVMGRLAGSDPDGAILLMAHYDSVPNSPGASDNGVSLAVLLETARTLAAAETPLKQDVVFLFTDAEEVGSYGAQAFVEEHRWADSLLLALNFEARGNGGAVLLFETSPGNRKLIRSLKAAASHPVGYSLSEELFKFLPNFTDFRAFEEAGVQGYNFANIEGSHHYHSALDRVAAVDMRTIRHQFAYALDLTRHFGNRSDFTGGASQSEAAFIYMPFLGLIHYAPTWDLAGLILTAALLIMVWRVAGKQGQATFRGSLLSAVAALVAMFVGTLIGLAVGMSLQGLLPDWSFNALGIPYGHVQAVWGASLLVLGLLAWACGAIKGRLTETNLALGVSFWWIVFATAAVFLIPGAAFLFVWPVFFVSLGLFAVTVLGRDWHAPIKAAVIALAAVPGMVIWVPLIDTIFQLFSLRLIAIGVLMEIVLVTLLFAPFLWIQTRKWRVLPLGAAVAGGLALAFLVAGSGGYDQNEPKRNSLFYAHHLDGDEHYWCSTDAVTDAWTEQYLTQNPKRDYLPWVFPGSSRRFLLADAPAADLAPPAIEILEDRVENGVRELQLHVGSYRRAANIRLYFEGANIELAFLENQYLGSGMIRLLYFAPPQTGFTLSLQLAPSDALRLRLLDVSYALPFLNDPRPKDMIPTSDFGWFQGAAIVSRVYDL